MSQILWNSQRRTLPSHLFHSGEDIEVPSRWAYIWGDENPQEWRIIFQPGLVAFRSAGLRFAWFARTSDFRADRHSGRSARGCRRNGFSISPAAFSRIAVFCRQARAESRNPGFGEFSQTGRGGMFGLRTIGKQAFVSRRIGVPVASRCRSLRFGDFRRRLPSRRRDLNGGLDSGSPRALSSATQPDFNELSRMCGIFARLGRRALRPE